VISKEMVERINFLARKQRNEGLSQDEKEEQNHLRQKYLQGIRQQLVEGLEEAGIPRKKGNNGCSCGDSGCTGHEH